MNESTLVPREEMSDFDWLARNVHVWPFNMFDSKPTEKYVWHQPYCGGDILAVFRDEPSVFTKDQWLARRAELQNKPSWKDAPEWAEWIAQDDDGEWYWYCSKPFVNETNDDTVWNFGDSFDHEDCEFGEVLGDWRDTLEKRPVDLSESAVTERLTEATQNVLAAVPNLLGEQFKFEHNTKPVTVSNETVQLEQPIAVTGTGNGSASESAFLIGRVIDLLRTSADHFSAEELAELHQLCDAELTKRDAVVCGGQKYLDAHWFERGELPPVGTECEIDLGAKWRKAFVVGRNYTGRIVVEIDTCDFIVADGCTFRPIRTERDVLIEIIKKTDDTDDRIADAILAAGFSLGAK